MNPIKKVLNTYTAYLNTGDNLAKEPQEARITETLRGELKRLCLDCPVCGVRLHIETPEGYINSHKED